MEGVDHMSAGEKEKSSINEQYPTNDLRSALDRLRQYPGQLIEIDHHQSKICVNRIHCYL